MIHTFHTKNNIAQLYFILGRAELHWNFSSLLKDGFDIHSFPTGSGSQPYAVLEILSSVTASESMKDQIFRIMPAYIC